MPVAQPADQSGQLGRHDVMSEIIANRATREAGATASTPCDSARHLILVRKPHITVMKLVLAGKGHRAAFESISSSSTMSILQQQQQ